MEGGSPTIRRRRLGRALRDLRERSGMTGSAAGAAVERSGSWISRVEGGRVGLRARDLRDLLDLYGMHDARRREELEALAREGKQRGWWSRYAEDLPEALIVLVGLEDEAQTIRGYQDSVVPGLLQTERYCRAVIHQGRPVLPPMLDAEIESRVEVRMARQSYVRERQAQLRFLLDEAVLYRAIGGSEVLGEQLEHLLALVPEPHVEIRTIPFAHGDRIVPTGPFTVMSFPRDPDTAWVDTPTGLAYVDEDKEVGVYNQIFDRMIEIALDEEETYTLIREARERLR